jgi:molecular chaperone DnaK
VEASPFGRRQAAPPRRSDPPLRRVPDARRAEAPIVRRPTLAVDLGTSGSSAILVTTERDQLVEDPDLGHALWPTAVAHDGTTPRVGGAAENYSRVHPENHSGRLKQLLGQPGPVPLGGASFAPTQLMAWFLGGMRAQTERLAGVEPTRAVVSVPVSYTPTDPRRADLLQAASMAGFTTVELLAEPLATVAAPLVGGPVEPGDLVLVCDFGAGGFTATLASMIKGGSIELLGYQEHPACSGAEIDRLIMAELLARAGRSGAELPHPGDDPARRLRSVRAQRALQERARAMKHQLSSHPSAVELVGPDEVAVELTAAELTELVAPLLVKAVGHTRHVLSSAGVRAGELAGILLTGGGSRMPAVAQAISEVYHRPIRTTVDQQRAVAEGAARFARLADERHMRARIPTERETPLRWDIPGGHATDLHWQIQPGTRFGAVEGLATVRLIDGSLWELRAGRTGTLLRTHLPAGSPVSTGDWLVTVELDARAFR